jgi:hypothetical protein
MRLSKIDPECAFDRRPRKVVNGAEGLLFDADLVPAQVCTMEMDSRALNRCKWHCFNKSFFFRGVNGPIGYSENWVILTACPSGKTARISKSAPTA